jgi:hypothetical protein
MPRESRISEPHDSFAEVLRAEISAESENLSAWVKQIQAQGAMKSLFGLEAWLRGIRSFFKSEHLPLGATDRDEITIRSFAAEMGIVREGLQICESHACDLTNPKIGGTFEFEEFVDVQMRKDRMMDFHISRIVEQLTPRDSISQLMAFLNDFRIMIGALTGAPGIDYRIFLSLGRFFERELKNCRYMDMFLNEHLRLQFDAVEDRSISQVLQQIQDKTTQRNVASGILYLFRFLRYLQLVSADLDGDRPLKKDLVLFSLLHEGMHGLSDFLRSRFLRNRETPAALRDAAELVAYSMKMESNRVMDRELVSVSRENDPGVIYARIENGHGLLLNCCQSGVVTLMQALQKSFDSSKLFPSRTATLRTSERLRQDLWELRQWLLDVLANGQDLDSAEIIEHLTRFREASLRSLMYRDWAEFESFSDALTFCVNFVEMRTHIRKFVSFLEMLIQEVSKRSVFQQTQTD